MEQNILYSMGKEGASNLVSLLSESLEPVVNMHNNDLRNLLLWPDRQKLVNTKR